MRASDRDRERAVSALARAAGEGRLSVETLSLRLELALGARQAAALDELTGDLPWWQRPPGALARALRRWLSSGPLPEQAPAEPLALNPESSRAVVGRSSSCDVCVAGEFISRQHVYLRRVAEGWQVTDLGSTNGTWLDGRRIDSAYARPGECLSLGGHLVRLPG